MKYLKVRIYSEEKFIGCAQYVSVTDENNSDKALLITLKNVKLNVSKVFYAGEKLKLGIILNEKITDFLYLILNEPLGNSKRTTFSARVDKKYMPQWQAHSTYVFHIYSKWLNGINLNWNELTTIEQKKAWLRACFKFKGVTNILPVNRTFSFDGNIIDDKWDFYCLLGEVFFGYRGYIGGDGNALLDCLNTLNINNPNHSSTIIFKNKNRISAILRNPQNKIDYFNYIVSDFKKNGFVVETPRYR